MNVTTNFWCNIIKKVESYFDDKASNDVPTVNQAIKEINEHRELHIDPNDPMADIAKLNMFRETKGVPKCYISNKCCEEEQTEIAEYDCSRTS